MHTQIQWNLSIVDMIFRGHLSIADTFLRNQLSPVMVNPLHIENLYSGHLSIADIFSRNQLSQATVKLLYFEPLYSGQLSIADTFSQNQLCPLLRGFIVIYHLQRKYLTSKCLNLFIVK